MSALYEMLSRRQMVIYCVQESTWKGVSAPKIAWKNSCFTFFGNGRNSRNVDVGVLVARK